MIKIEAIFEMEIIGYPCLSGLNTSTELKINPFEYIYSHLIMPS